MRGDVTVNQRTALDDWAVRPHRDVRPHRRHDGRCRPCRQARPDRSRPRCPWERLRSADAFAALPISVEVVQQGATEPTGRTRTFVAWNGRKEYVPLKVATVLPLTLDPDVALFSRDDAVPAVRLAAAPSDPTRAWPASSRAPAARASTSPSTRPCSDPAPGSAVVVRVVRPGRAPGPPRRRAAPPRAPPAPRRSGTSAPGTTPTTTPTTAPTTTSHDPGHARRPRPPPPSRASATRSRRSCGAAASGRCPTPTPMSPPPLRVDPSNSLVRDLVTRASTLATRLGQPARTDIVWPVDGLMPAGREQGIETLLSGTSVKKPAGIVVNAAAVTRATAYTPTARRVTAAGTRLLAYDPRLSALLPARTDPSPVLSVQRYLAETLVLLGERAGTPRSVLVTAPRTYDPDGAALATFLAATSSAPWLEPVDAASLLSDSGADQAVEQASPATPVASAAPPAVLDRAPPRPDGRAARHAAQRLLGAARRRGVRAHLPRGARRAREHPVALPARLVGRLSPPRWPRTSGPRRARSASCRGRARSTSSPRRALCGSPSRTASTTPSRTSACGSFPTTRASGSSSSRAR